MCLRGELISHIINRWLVVRIMVHFLLRQASIDVYFSARNNHHSNKEANLVIVHFQLPSKLIIEQCPLAAQTRVPPATCKC